MTFVPNIFHGVVDYHLQKQDKQCDILINKKELLPSLRQIINGTDWYNFTTQQFISSSDSETQRLVKNIQQAACDNTSIIFLTTTLKKLENSSAKKKNSEFGISLDFQLPKIN